MQTLLGQPQVSPEWRASVERVMKEQAETLEYLKDNDLPSLKPRVFTPEILIISDYCRPMKPNPAIQPHLLDTLLPLDTLRRRLYTHLYLRVLDITESAV